MKFLFSYKGINKVLNDGINYQDIVRFVHENFFLKLSKWTMYYIDSDGDSISLDNDFDVQAMIQNQNAEQVKIYVKDIDYEDQHEDQYRVQVDEEVIIEKTSGIAEEQNKEDVKVERQNFFEAKYEQQSKKIDTSKFTNIPNVSYTPLYIPIMPQGSQTPIMAPIFVPIMTLLPNQSKNEGQMTFVPVMTSSNQNIQYPFPGNIQFPQFSQQNTAYNQNKFER